jgi:putative endonuclease
MPDFMSGIQGRKAKEMRQYFVYILASRRNGTLYTGVTNDIVRRIFEHKAGALSGFTKRYGVKTLVRVEAFDDVRDAIRREKAIKHLPRVRKLALIEASNPTWQDLFESINA